MSKTSILMKFVGAAVLVVATASTTVAMQADSNTVAISEATQSPDAPSPASASAPTEVNDASVEETPIDEGATTVESNEPADNGSTTTVAPTDTADPPTQPCLDPDGQVVATPPVGISQRRGGSRLATPEQSPASSAPDQVATDVAPSGSCGTGEGPLGPVNETRDGATVAEAGSTPVSTPRYVVEAISFKVVDESGVDWLGADEPYWVFGVATGSEEHVSDQLFYDADSGETFYFGPMCLVSDCDQGHSGPMEVRAALSEFDPGLAVLITVDDWIIANDGLGSVKVSWSLGELAIQLPEVGDFFTQTLDLNGGSSLGGSSDYDLVIRVRRVQDDVR